MIKVKMEWENLPNNIEPIIFLNKNLNFIICIFILKKLDAETIGVEHQPLNGLRLLHLLIMIKNVLWVIKVDILIRFSIENVEIILMLSFN